MGDVGNPEVVQPQGSQQQENPQRNQVQPRNLYEILGVPNTATQKQIDKAFKDRAKELHPDSNGGDQAAEDEFKKANEAFSVLRKPNERARYDGLGHDVYYEQTKGWNPIPKPDKPTGHRVGETVRRPNPSGRSGDNKPPSYDPPNFDVEDLFDDLSGIFGGFVRGDTSNPFRKRPDEQSRSEKDQESVKRYTETKEAQARKDKEWEEERIAKFKEEGSREAMRYANVLFMPTMRTEMGQILDVIVEEEKKYFPRSLREIRKQILYHVDREDGLLSDNVIDKLVEKYSADNEFNPLNIDKRNIREVVSGLIMRLRVARGLVQGNTKPADLPRSGDNKNTREAFSSEFNRVWNNISTYGEPVDKRKNWFVPLTPEEVVIERRRAQGWIKEQGFQRGEYLKQLSGSPDVIEDEKFVKGAIKKSRGLLGSLLTDKKTIDHQYKYFMDKIGKIGGSQYIKDVLAIAEKTFKKKFSQEKGNKDKDVAVEWEITLARLKDESEALELQERLQKNLSLPRPDSQKLKEEYYKTDPIGDFPGADIDLYSAGLKEGFAG